MVSPDSKKTFGMDGATADGFSIAFTKQSLFNPNESGRFDTQGADSRNCESPDPLAMELEG